MYNNNNDGDSNNNTKDNFYGAIINRHAKAIVRVHLVHLMKVQ